MEIVGNNASEQAKQVMKNLSAVLEEAGSDFSKVIKCSIFLDDMGDFGDVNEVYGSFFQNEPPARETVAVQTLPKSVLVEISCIAFI
jgi:2-iminobutanoate/2-iminopropanoate deaminase